MIKVYPTTLDNNVKVCSYLCRCVNRSDRLVHTVLDSCDVVAIHGKFIDKYSFNTELADRIVKSGKPLVVFDYFEYGSGCHDADYILGELCEVDYVPEDSDYWAMDKWMAANLKKVAVYFRREQPVKTRYTWTVPIEYPHFLELPPIVTKDDYVATRTCDILYWFRSTNPTRGEMKQHMGREYRRMNRGYPGYYSTSIYSLLKSDQCKVCVHQVQTENDLSMETIVAAQMKSKVVISLNGVGVKCFRDSEGTVGSVLARQANNKDWSYNFEAGVHHIDLENIPGCPDQLMLSSLYKIHATLKDIDYLYGMYLLSQEIAAKTQCVTYMRHVADKIEEAI